MIIRQCHGRNVSLFVYFFLLFKLVDFAWASQGDRLPDFRRCVSVCVAEDAQQS